MKTIRNEIRKHFPREGEARRLFHGRGHSFEGYSDLTIDAYPPLIMVILYRERRQPWLDELTALLRAELPQEPEAILLQERFLPWAPSRLLHGTLPVVLDAIEEGLRFRLRLGDAQNVGFFPDMAVGRTLVRQLGGNKRVLNLFAYSCGFSLAALAGGAAHVVNLDMNRGALELGKLNHRINGFDPRRAHFLPLELFRSFGKLRKLGPFDLVICDPPASQGESFTAERHWPKLIRRLPELLAPGGEILACLNGPHLPPDFLTLLFSEILPEARRLASREPGPDFPEAEPDKGVILLHYALP
jgi:23S rRNA (cytosine1962-C5)-methyltransferase